jgi:poly-gamma-glutamate synthesis protein (capsule biosynthesis protein)
MYNNIEKLFDNGKLEWQVPDIGKTWSLTATGDYAILPDVEKYIIKNGLEGLTETINKLIASDIPIANLEVGLTSSENVTGKGVRGGRNLFLKVHKNAPFSVYSMANNHVRDAGAEELSDTLELFKMENIKYVGAGVDSAEAEAPLFVDIKGVKLGILAFAQEENQLAGENISGAAELSEGKIIEAVKKLLVQCDVPIVIMHEGFEFMTVPRRDFIKLCRKLAEIGVKLVIGHHSHVPQGIERVDESLIFYSLGNFLFDQPHFKPYTWSRRSFVPAVSFKGTAISSVELRPFEIETGTEGLYLRVASEKERRFMLEHLKTVSMILNDEAAFNEYSDSFYSNILLPEFFSYIRAYGNQHDNGYSDLISQFKGQKPIHNLFSDFVELYGKS